MPANGRWDLIRRLKVNVYRGYVLGVEWPGREVNESFPCSAEVKKR